MKIAITVNTSWNIFNFRLGLIKAILSKGYEVLTIAPQDEFSEKLVSLGCKFRPISMDNTGTNPITDFGLFLQLRKIYAEEKPDIIYQYTVKPNIYGSMAARSNAIPVINNVSGLGTVFLNKGLANFVAKRLYRWAFKKVELVFFQNKDDKRDFLREIRLPDLESHVISGSGVDLKKFKPKEELNNQPVKFLLIARLILDKGVMEYLQAAREIKKTYLDVEFLVLGQLDELHTRGIRRKLISDYQEDGSITYLGSHPEVESIIEQSTCVVLPSYREGTPKTLIEAAAMKRPIIATDVPGCREVVQDGVNGLLCQVKNPHDLKNKMIKIIESELNELIAMGTQGRKLAEEKYDENIIIDKYLSETTNILSKK